MIIGGYFGPRDQVYHLVSTFMFQTFRKCTVYIGSGFKNMVKKATEEKCAVIILRGSWLKVARVGSGL